MKHKLHLTIPTPCHERWDDMTATDRGAFCHSCRKEVVDFSAMTDAEVIRWLQRHGTGCGRFRADQLDRDMSLPVVHDSPLRWKVLLMSLLPAFSLAPVAARAVLPPLTDQAPARSKTDTAIAKADTTLAACDTMLTGICGRILDETGEGLLGATVQVIDANGKTTGQGAVADIDGNFTLALRDTGTVTLRATYVGYETQVLTARPSTHPYMTIRMKEDTTIRGDMVGIMVIHRTPTQKVKAWFRRGIYTLTHLREHRQYKLAQRRMKD